MDEHVAERHGQIRQAGDAHWESWFGKDKSKWIFNTKCCATNTNYQHASCKASDSSSSSGSSSSYYSSYSSYYPSPSPSGGQHGGHSGGHSGGHHQQASPSPHWWNFGNYFGGGGGGSGSSGSSVSSACQNAVGSTCSGLHGSSCMECAHTHHDSLISSCSGGAPDMRTACDNNIDVVH